MIRAQLEWDRVVYPLSENTWECVKQTAAKFKDLEVDDQFHVVYKQQDDEDTVVQNELDLKEALDWAEENGKCLELLLPYPSDGIDSEWSKISDEYLPPDYTTPGQVPTPPVDEALTGSFKLPDDQEFFKQNSVQSLPKVEEKPVQEEEKTSDKEEVVEEAKPADRSLKRKQSDVDNVVLETFMDLLMMYEKSLDVDFSLDRTQRLISILSSESKVKSVCEFFQNPTFQKAVVSIARGEMETPGAAEKKAINSIIMNQVEIVQELIQIVPEASNVLFDILYSLRRGGGGIEKNTQMETSSSSTIHHRQKHSGIFCTGCTDSEKIQVDRFLAGFRAETGEILGDRYQSAVATDVNLCGECEASGNFHELSPFLKISDPSTAPEILLCILPQQGEQGPKNSMMKDFLEFLEQKKKVVTIVPPFREDPKEEEEAAAPKKEAAALKEEAVAPIEEAAASKEEEATPVPTFHEELAPNHEKEPSVMIQKPTCKHSLKAFVVPNKGAYDCDICHERQEANQVLHGCRLCNYDVCSSCQQKNFIPIQQLPRCKFVADLTLLDGSRVEAGGIFPKIWRLRNSGNEPIPEGVRLRHEAGESFGFPKEGLEVASIGPGDLFDISVDLIMPTQPGRYTSYWRMVNNDNVKFGTRLWVTVNVIPSVPVVPPVAERTPPPPPVTERIENSDEVVPPLYVTSVCQITEMGFLDIDKIVRILREENGDVERTLDRLFRNVD